MYESGEIELRRTYRFCASHRLWRDDWSEERNDEVYAEAANPYGHGHNYRLTLVLSGTPDPESGLLVDLRALDAIVDERVVLVYDHHNLNADVDSLQGIVPTTENLLVDIWNRLVDHLGEVRLREVILRQDEFLTGRYRG